MPTKRLPLTAYYVVDLNTGCWNWTGTKRGAYGQVSNPKYYRGCHRYPKMIGAHVYSYELVKGPVPDGLILHHKCENKGCINPDHLEPTTHAKNIRQGGQTLLTEEIVKELRKDLASGMSQWRASKNYGISQATVSQIKMGYTWKDVIIVLTQPSPMKYGSNKKMNSEKEED